VVRALERPHHRLVDEPGWADYRQSLDWSTQADAALSFLERVVGGTAPHGFIGPDHR
jgi:hypothetical protein